ncbi:MAG: RNA polymerase sigma factor [Opitutales bacterium]
MDEPAETTQALLQAAYRYALALTHHHYEAEDLVQEAWLRVWRKYGEQCTRPLLLSTVRNRFVDGLRRGRLATFEPVKDHDLSDPGDQPVPGGSADLDVLLAYLHAEEREALFLHVVEGQTTAEIAVFTGTTRGTVLSRLHRARERLRRHPQLRRELDSSVDGETGKQS